ncbi:MAG: ABC transporter permease [Thermoprotei archaeon]
MSNTVVLTKNVVKDIGGLIGGIIVVLFYLTAIVVAVDPHITGYNPYSISVSNELLPPSFKYPFGTDNLGRSVFAEVLASTPIDALVSTVVVVSAVVVGGILGTIAGYFGGLLEEAIMRITDAFLAFPGLILAVGISAALGPGAINAMVALIVVSWPTYTRLARGDTLVVRELPFIKSAKLSGRSVFYILRKHILPNVSSSLLSYATVNVGFTIITFSVLGYLGLGAQPPSVEWGMLVFEGQSYLRTAPWFPLAPAVAILIVTLGFSFLGDALRDALDPTRKR